MSGDIRMKAIQFLYFFIGMCFLLTPVQSDEAQICSNMFMCHPTDSSLFLYCTPFVGIMVMTCPHKTYFDTKTLKCQEEATQSDCFVSLTTTTTPIPRKGENCSESNCKLPNCRCANDLIPGSIQVQSVPQMVLVTFDDGVNDNNIKYYRDLEKKNLKNPDGCPMRFTFFVCENNNDFDYVKELYQQGHEIASHSKSHRMPVLWWKNATEKDLEDEMVGMRKLLMVKSEIPIEKIKGTRVPYLQLGGDNLYRAIKESFLWDSTMLATWSNNSIWPFTLDYTVTSNECVLPLCPNKTYAGFWEVPLIRWQDSDGKSYGMTDEKRTAANKSEMFSYFKKNFDHYYTENRAPFGITLHATWFNHSSTNFEVLSEFLQYLSQEYEDVWVIPVSQALDWVRNPKPRYSLSEIPSWDKSNCK